MAEPEIAALCAAFTAVQGVWSRRRGSAPTDPGPYTTPPGTHTVRFRELAETLSDDELHLLRRQVSRALVRRVDASMGGPVSARTGVTETAPIPPSSRIALVSMPWMAAGMPSIQLATVHSALVAEELDADRYEFYVDFASYIGLHLYNLLSNSGGFVEEWVFARHYFGAECSADLTGFKEVCPPLGLGPEQDSILDALCVVADEFLEQAIDELDVAGRDVIGFSLTISQLASSMALARLVKKRNPRAHVVFGGTACAGPMGPAILRVCPQVDLVVQGEAEKTFPEVVRRLRRGVGLDGVHGISWRRDGEIASSGPAPLHEFGSARPRFDYDPYFARLARAEFRDVPVWIPFEGSRGCWYGEHNQCTFCGLHEIMKSRNAPWQQVLEELESFEQRYGVTRFFAVDLILPREFHDTLLSAIRARGHDWTIFYEVKANLTYAELEGLAAAGIRWIQPGIESLDGETLRRMHKGVTPLQNVQLLKWCMELGVQPTWNMIVGLPGDTPEGYRTIVDRARSLHHLEPPKGATLLQLHRFSPYFASPESHDIRPSGAHPLYQHVFPVAQADLDDLVYHHSFGIDGAAVDAGNVREVSDAIVRWRAARRTGSELALKILPDGAAEIFDSREGEGRTFVLTAAQAQLYRFLDSATAERTLPRRFAEKSPAAATELALDGGVRPLLARWMRERLVMSDGGRVLALATSRSRVSSDVGVAPLPVPYLE